MLFNDKEQIIKHPFSSMPNWMKNHGIESRQEQRAEEERKNRLSPQRPTQPKDEYHNLK